MIDIEILTSSDSKRCGRYLIHKNSISFGNDSVDDLFLESEELLAQYFTLKIDEFKLYLHINSEVEFILVNGKRTTASKVLKAKDKIKVLDTEFQINNFLIEKPIPRKEFLNKRVEELKNEESELIPILQRINEI